MLSTTILAWIGIATTFLVTAGQWVDPANVKTPWNWSPAARATLFFVLTAVVSLLKAFTDAPGTPWMQTLLVAGPTFVLALVGHFGHAAVGGSVSSQRGFVGVRAMAVVAFGFTAFLTLLPACSSFWTPARKGAVEDVASCIALKTAAMVLEGDPSPAQELAIAEQCSTQASVVHDFIVGHPDAIAEARRTLAEVRAAARAGACR